MAFRGVTSLRHLAVVSPFVKTVMAHFVSELYETWWPCTLTSWPWYDRLHILQMLSWHGVCDPQNVAPSGRRLGRRRCLDGRLTWSDVTPLALTCCLSASFSRWMHYVTRRCLDAGRHARQRTRCFWVGCPAPCRKHIDYRVGQLKWSQLTFLLVTFGTWMYR